MIFNLTLFFRQSDERSVIRNASLNEFNVTLTFCFSYHEFYYVKFFFKPLSASFFKNVSTGGWYVVRYFRCRPRVCVLTMMIHWQLIDDEDP